MNDRPTDLKTSNENKPLKYFWYNKGYETFKYEGYEISRSSTHIKIFDIKKKKNFELPLSQTVVEDISL